MMVKLMILSFSEGNYWLIQSNKDQLTESPAGRGCCADACMMLYVNLTDSCCTDFDTDFECFTEVHDTIRTIEKEPTRIRALELTSASCPLGMGNNSDNGYHWVIIM